MQSSADPRAHLWVELLKPYFKDSSQWGCIFLEMSFHLTQRKMLAIPLCL